MISLLKNTNVFAPGLRYELNDIYTLMQVNGGFNTADPKIRKRIRGALANLKKRNSIQHVDYAEYILN